jgi:hypothetical protein
LESGADGNNLVIMLKGEQGKMPTVLRIKGYRFFFYSMEGREPPHIHVEYADFVAKFWLEPVRLASVFGFKDSELRRIRVIILEDTHYTSRCDF